MGSDAKASPLFSHVQTGPLISVSHTPLHPAPKTHQKIEETENGTGGTKVPSRPARGATSSFLCFFNFWCATHQPARRHPSVVPNTARPEPPHQPPRRALSAPTERLSATLVSRALKCTEARLKPADSQTCG